MLIEIDGVPQKPYLLGLETFSHHKWCLKVHASGELPKTIDHPVAWDVQPVLMGYRVQRPTYQPGTRAHAYGSCYVSVCGELSWWNRSHDFIDAFIPI
jgi:hypothetical protein